MDNIYPSLAVGVILVVLGAGLARWHWVAWAAQRRDSTASDRELLYYRAQFRRRLQVSVILMTLGILIPVGDALMMQRQRPGLFAAYWSIVLLMTLWIVLLAAVDWLAGRIQRRAALNALAGLARKRRELEEEVARLRRERSNGHEPYNEP